MSANIRDAINGAQSVLRSREVPAGVAEDARDNTEDLAEEVTSELNSARDPRVAPASWPPAPPPARDAVAGDGAVAAGEGLLRDRYRLELQLGNGGTATVHRAIDLRRDAATSGDGFRVAIKLLRPELRGRPQSVARMQREFRQTMLVAHPNVVRFFDLDCDGGAWFIVMELLSGETLGPALRRSAPAGLPAAEALRIALAAGDALAHAHARGVTHGDVKPDNMFLTTAGELRLIDFGVAPESSDRPPGPEAPPPVTVAATRVYASPEVLSGEPPVPRDDVFSLACVIHEMVAGRHPYGRRGADLARDAAVVPERLAKLGAARASAVAAALSLARAGRPDMAEFVRALRAGDEPPAARVPAAVAAAIAAAANRADSPPPAPVAAPPTVAPAATPAARRPGLTLLAAVAAGLALVLGILIGRFDAGDESSPKVAQARAAAVPEPAKAPPAAVPQANVAMAPPLQAGASQAPAETAVAGSPPGLVFFDAPRMIVSNRAMVAAIPLRHLNRGRRAVSVNWRAIDGTARSGRDYGGPASGAETFVEGHSFRILYVPIVPNAGAAPDRSFSVELTGVSEGAEIGPTPRVEVTILGQS